MQQEERQFSGELDKKSRSAAAMHLFILACVLGFVALVLVLVFLMAQPFVAKVPSAPPVVEAAALREHVRVLSVAYYPRAFDHRRNLDLAADYVLTQLKGTGAQVSEQEFTVDGERYRNIVARFGPDSGPLLVIGAHYDAFGDSDFGYPPGADDNASGVAGLIELARLLAQGPQRRPIELVAYTLEEPPHFRTEEMGSAHHASMLKQQGREVALMLSLEMIGYFSDSAGSQEYPLRGIGMLYPDRGNFIALAGRFGDFGEMRRAKALMLGATGLPVYSFNAPALIPGVDFSDHLSYWAEGYPAIMVTDTAFFRNKAYHGSGDTWDRLDYARMAQVVQGVYAVTQGW